MKIDVVIVNWNAGNLLLECVESVIRYGNPALGKIIVVDNGSTDGSENAIEGLPNVILLRVGTNLGFSKACNMGAARTDAAYLLFLNPDTQLFPDSLMIAFDFMNKPENAKIGICGVQLVDEQGVVARSCSRFPSLGGYLAHASGLDRFFPAIGNTMNEWDHRTTRQVDQVIGAFFLIRRNVFEATDGFDERFFVYFDEVDLAYRAKQLGWSSIYLAETQAYHAGGGTSDQIKAMRLFYSLRSRTLYAFKHFTKVEAVIVLFSTLFIELTSRCVLALGRRSWDSFRNTCEAYGMFFRWLPAWIHRGVTR